MMGLLAVLIASALSIVVGKDRLLEVMALNAVVCAIVYVGHTIENHGKGQK